MFFDIIIPTYNSRKYIGRALNSILDNDCLDEIEVIIADDQSTESFDDIIQEYENKIHIKKIMNSIHYGAPYGGREFGAQAATADWICFMDHDDEWVPHAFDDVKNYILENNIHNYLVTNFYTFNDASEESVEVIQALNWTHGKFYEKRFWNEYDIHYADTRSCEDINLSVQIACLLYNIGITPNFYQHFTYIWHQYPESLSQASGIGEYFFHSFPDYIDGTLKVYLDNFLKTQQDPWFYVFNTSSMIYYLYFYYQGLKYKLNNCPKIPKLYYKKIYENFKRMKKYFGWTTKNFLLDTKYNDELKAEFDNVRTIALKQVPFFETETFDHFIKTLFIRSII